MPGLLNYVPGNTIPRRDALTTGLSGGETSWELGAPSLAPFAGGGARRVLWYPRPREVSL